MKTCETIIILTEDRYTGAYSGGLYNAIADNDSYDWDDTDLIARAFWEKVKRGDIVAVSDNSPKRAMEKLIKKLDLAD